MNITELKHELRMRDIAGDPWGVAMGAMFNICAIAYEQLDHYVWVERNAEWEYQPGAGGNNIEEDNMFADLELTQDEIVEIGNFLNRLIKILEKTDYAY